MADTSSEDAFDEQFLNLLASLDFHGKYYAFVEHAKQGSGKRCHFKVFREHLKEYPALKFYSKERFFRLQETVNEWEFTLTLAYLSSKLELILIVKRGELVTGTVVPKLACDAAQLLDPEFIPQPLSPKIPFGTVEELQEAVEFSLSLYEEVKTAVLAFEEWK